MRLVSRRAVRGFLVRALGRPAGRVLVTVLRLSGRKVGVALMYHRVDERTGDPARELVPPHSAQLFEAQLRHVRSCYRVVPASELLAASTERRRGQRFPVAITFDDDLRCHRRVAAPVLQRLRLPATFFVCGASLRRPFAFWWEQLQVAVDRGIPVRSRVPALASAPTPAGDSGDPTGIHALGETIIAMDPAARDAVTRGLGTLVEAPHDAGLPAEELRSLAQAGFEIGFHTLRHDALALLSDGPLERALREGRSEVEAIVGHAVTAIAYPHGRADARVAEAARTAGYGFGFTTQAQPVQPHSDPLLIGRIEPSFASAGGFALRLLRTLVDTGSEGE